MSTEKKAAVRGIDGYLLFVLESGLIQLAY